MDVIYSFGYLNAVKVITKHQAKGLEFPVVIPAGVTERIYNRNSQNETLLIEIPKELLLVTYPFHRREKIQRTFYVGMSIDQKLLIISSFNGNRTKFLLLLKKLVY